MANSYDSWPILVDTVMAAGWRSLQTLNTGNSPATLQNPSPSARQWGFRVSKISWTNMSAAGHTVVIVDPNSSQVLFQAQAGADLSDQEYDFGGNGASWRDFEVTTIDSGTLLIWYRA